MKKMIRISVVCLLVLGLALSQLVAYSAEAVDKSNLAQAIEVFKGLDESYFTTTSWNAAKAAALAAEGVFAISEDQEEVDDATEALYAAVTALVYRANKSELWKSMAEYIGLLPGTKYTTQSWAVAALAYAAALDVFNDADATVGGVGDAKASLDLALAALEEVYLRPGEDQPTAFVLRKTYTKTIAYETNDNAPTIVFSSDNTGIATVDGDGIVTGVAKGLATITVKEMRSGLFFTVEVSVVDADALKAALDEFAALTGTDYTLITWNAADAAALAAKGVFDNLDATQAQVDAALAALRDALDALELIYLELDEDQPASFVLRKGYDSQIKLDTNALDITYASDNTSIATVDAGGKVLGVAKGTAIITATDGRSGLFVTVTVEVVDADALKAALDEFAALTGTDYTLISWNAAAAAALAGQDVFENLASTQAQVDAALAALRAALDALELIYLDLDEDQPASFVLRKGYDSQILLDTNALDITYASDNTSIATVDAGGKVTGVAKGTAIITITDGRSGLFVTVTVDVVDADALEAALDEFAALTGTDYTLVSWDAAAAAALAAQDVFDNLASTQAQVDAALAALRAALDALVEIYLKLDLDQPASFVLRKGYSSQIALDTNALDITYASDDEDIATVDALGKVLGVAKGTAIITATDGRSGLFVTVTVDVTDADALGALIDEFLALSPLGYTAESWEAAWAVYEDAQAVFDNLASTQAQIDAAWQALRDAIDALDAFELSFGNYSVTLRRGMTYQIDIDPAFVSRFVFIPMKVLVTVSDTGLVTAVSTGSVAVLVVDTLKGTMVTITFNISS